MRAYSSQKEDGGEGIRTDAAANREAIVRAARRLLSSRGPEVPLSEIAREAGVSRSTFYRNFPDRQELIAAVFHMNLDILEDYAGKVKGESHAFFHLLEAVVRLQVEFQALAPYLSRGYHTLTERLQEIFREPIERALEEGLLRPDFKAESDLGLLLMMMGGALMNLEGEKQEGSAGRALQLVNEGLAYRGNN